MNLVDEFKNIIEKCILNDRIDDAYNLLISLFNTNIKLDDLLCYYAAVICERKGLYGLVKFYLLMGNSLNPDNEDIVAFYEDIWGKEFENEFYDLSYIRRKLNILLVKGIMEPLNLFLDEICKTFILLGHNVFVFDHKEDDVHDRLSIFLRQKIDLVFAFNNAFLNITTSDNDFLINKLKCPVVTFNVDHAFNYMGLIGNVYTSERYYQFVVDKDDVYYLDEFSGLKSCNYFMPHGGTLIGFNNQPLAAREIDVLYVGSPKVYKHTDDEIYKKCLKLLRDNPKRSSFDVVSEFLQEVTESDTAKEAVQKYGRENFDRLLSAETTVLGEERIQMIEALIRAGVKVHVFGLGWEELPISKEDNFILGNVITAYECIEKMRESKIVLNSMPWFKSGSHERIINSMLAGALCVTDNSRWIEANFINREELFVFEPGKYDELVSIVKEALDNPQKYQIVADKGYNKAAVNHTWSDRAIRILNQLEDVLY